MERKQFTFYRSFYEAIQKMRTKRERADAYDIICNYALNGVEPDLEKVSVHIAAAFEFIRPVLNTAARRSARLQRRLAETEVRVAMGEVDNI